MSDSQKNRRDFLKTTSAAVAGGSLAVPAAAAVNEGSDILNHNPKMTYRPLGKTGFMISEVSLGGHGGKTVADRVPVLEKVAAIFLQMIPDLPIPETTRRPRHSQIRSTAR